MAHDWFESGRGQMSKNWSHPDEEGQLLTNKWPAICLSDGKPRRLKTKSKGPQRPTSMLVQSGIALISWTTSRFATDHGEPFSCGSG